MGGSGGGNWFPPGVVPKDLQFEIRQAELELAESSFGPELNAFLSGSLAAINSRDIDRVNDCLDDVEDHLTDELEQSFKFRFGGSVAKHTYVDGLSDVDTLLVLKDDPKHSPQAILEHLTTVLRARLTNGSVDHGRVAVTITYTDGMQIQLVPAVKTPDGLRVPAWKAKGWAEINPEKFAAALTRRNDQCGGKLIPTIKLAKAINATLPEAHQLSGYHGESLAIAAFRGYDGSQTLSKMLPHFFEQIPELLLQPIKDKTGQSVHVDTYLGAGRSLARRDASHIFERLSKRMENAVASRSVELWQRLFGEE
jgi:hypothetical protein